MNVTTDTGKEPSGYGEKWRKQRLSRARPFVGFEGVGCKLDLAEEQGGLRITGATSNYFWIILGLLAFGPGLNVMAFLEWETFAENHWAMLGVVGAFSVFAWAFLLKYLGEFLLGRPVIEVPFGGDDLLLRRGRAARPFRAFKRGEIDRFTLVETAYRSDSTMHPNYTVRLVTKDGEEIDLCTSDNRTRIEFIGGQLAGRFKVRFDPVE